MATPVEETQIKTKKPSNSAFKQQRLPAWQPILTAGTVLPTFFVIGLAFIPIGIGLLLSSDEVMEYPIEYTNCVAYGSNETCDSRIRTAIENKRPPPTNCECRLDFQLDKAYKANVFMYYGLTNYYQNHRRYVKSRNDRQLLGREDYSVDDCKPFASRHWGPNNEETVIAPCGAIANSLFNDTLELYKKEGNDYKLVPVKSDNIVWSTDLVKFQNPKNVSSLLKYAPPFNWVDKDIYKMNGHFQNEDLIVWMRTAALPTFRKLYRRIDHSAPGYSKQLDKGDYQLRVIYNYPVSNFQGTKRMILSNTSWLGGRNPFLGIAYIVVGTICLLLAFVFLVIHNKFGRRMYGWHTTHNSSESRRLRTTTFN